MASYVVKIQFEDSLRRLTLGGDELAFSYEQLVNRVRDLFQLAPSAQLVLTYIDKDGDVVTMVEDQDLKDALVAQSLNPLRMKLSVSNSNRPTDVKVSSPAKDANVKVNSPAEVPQTSNVEEVQKAATGEGAAQSREGVDVNDKTTSSAAPGKTEDSKSPEVPNAEKNVENVIHYGVQCDVCGVLPIAGPRFKSSKKSDYDLCRTCFETAGVDPKDYFEIERSLNRAGHPFVGPRMMRLSPAFGCRNSKSCTPATAAANSPPRSSPVSAEKPGAEPKEVVHNGVTCDGCRISPIAGPRFKSNTKFNYDLCLGCFEKSGSSADKYSRVDRPVADIHAVVGLGRLTRLASPYRPMCRVWVMNGPRDSSAAKETAAKQDANPGDSSKQEEATPAPQIDATTEDSTAKIPATSANFVDSGPKSDSKVDASVENSKENASGEKPAAEDAPVNNSAETFSVQNEADADLSTRDGLLAKLSAMGFTDQKLNGELLQKNKLDLRTTLDDLCAAEEWDPILEELQEMGFYDSDMNRRLMFKNNGSVKRVVKELVQLSKEPATVPSGKGQKND